MIKKAKFLCVFIVTGLFCANFAMADSLVVKDGVIYSSETNSLIVSVVLGEIHPSSCTTRTIEVPNATADSDIVISGINAFVKTDGAVVTVPIPECLADDSFSVSDCIARANLVTGELIVPCVEVETSEGILDDIFEAIFEQRGNSSNWEVISAPINEKFKN